jgi:hypothetical protein
VGQGQAPLQRAGQQGSVGRRDPGHVPSDLVSGNGFQGSRQNGLGAEQAPHDLQAIPAQEFRRIERRMVLRPPEGDL